MLVYFELLSGARRPIKMLVPLLVSWQDGVALGVAAGIAYLLVMWLAALVWAYRDVEARTRDPFVRVLSLGTIAVFNLPGLLLYLIVRPSETLAERYDRQLEAEALMQELQEQPACPSCRRRVEGDFLVCPYCRAPLKEPCPECSRPLAFGWAICPYSATPLRDPAPVSPSARPANVGEPAGQAASAEEAAALRQRRPRPASTAAFTPPARPQAGGGDSAADAGA